MCRSCVVACTRGAMCPRRAWTDGPIPAHPWLARPPPCTLTTMSGASARPAMRPPRRQRPPPGTPPGRPGGAWWTASVVRCTRRRTRRLRAARHRPRPPLLHLRPPAPLRPLWVPILSSRSTSQRSGTSPSRASSDMPSNRGGTHQTQQLHLNTSIPQDRHTTTCPLRGSASQPYRSGPRVVANTSLIQMVVIKVSRSLVGTTLMVPHEGTSHCLTSVVKNVELRCPKRLASPTTRMVFETTHLSRYPVRPIRPRVLYLVSKVVLYFI